MTALCLRITAETRQQQLLEIWNKAKGKERDIMLWGDEVWSWLSRLPHGVPVS